MAGLSEIPVLRRDLSDADAMAAGLVENLQRRDLNAIEEALGLRRLIDEFDLTQDALGEAVGKSRSYIANSLRLLNLPATVQAQVSEGLLSAGHARAALAHTDPALAARTIIARQLSVREAERLAAQAPATNANRSRTPHADTRSPDQVALEARLSERLGLAVAVKHGQHGGTVTIRYTSLEQLDALMQLLA